MNYMKSTLFYLFLLLLVPGCSETGTWALLQGKTMGTYYNVTFRDSENTIDHDNLHNQIDNLLQDINQAMSTYIGDSELSRLNRNNVDTPVVISEALFEVINTAQYISDITDGAFDITVGPLVNLWGFGPETRSAIPDDDEIELTLAGIGYEKLVLDETKSSITKKSELMYIDLSALAKGYAVDRIAKQLELLGIKDYLVDIGGELRANGSNKQGLAWQIGIEKPDPYARNAQTIVSLNNMAMATSGDYRNFFERDGNRYTHTIDPVTGRPVTHELASVTVIHKNCMHADALATALLVMGKDAGMALANQLEIPIYMISRSNNGFTDNHNTFFEKYLGKQ